MVVYFQKLSDFASIFQFQVLIQGFHEDGLNIGQK